MFCENNYEITEHNLSRTVMSDVSYFAINFLFINPTNLVTIKLNKHCGSLSSALCSHSVPET